MHRHRQPVGNRCWKKPSHRYGMHDLSLEAGVHGWHKNGFMFGPQAEKGWGLEWQLWHCKLCPQAKNKKITRSTV